jgi:hypothetical protein
MCLSSRPFPYAFLSVLCDSVVFLPSSFLSFPFVCLVARSPHSLLHLPTAPNAAAYSQPPLRQEGGVLVSNVSPCLFFARGLTHTQPHYLFYVCPWLLARRFCVDASGFLSIFHCAWWKTRPAPVHRRLYVFLPPFPFFITTHRRESQQMRTVVVRFFRGIALSPQGHPVLLSSAVVLPTSLQV